MKMDSPQDHPSGRKRRPENSKTVKTGPVDQPINRQSTEEINVVKVLPSKTTGHLIPLLLLTIAAGATRLWRLGQPLAVIFDELFYSRFVHMYTNRIFFFDSNPPFGKQLIATAAYLAGYGNQNETFEQIGDPYAEDTPIVVLRLLPALFGACLIPVSYLISTELGYSRFESAVTACCFLFDNALVTGSRFVLIDSINLCLLLLAVLFVLRFTHEACLSYTCVKYGLLTGLFMGLSISTKFLSLNTLLVLGWVVVRHFWKTIDDLTISAGKLWKYLLFCVFVVFWVPLGVYVATFYVHFLVLNKAGPYDAMMSTRFQASLEGGLAAITQGQPYDIAYGSQITLRNVAGVNEEPCWLHSHDAVYPVRYEGTNRGSSHQQQVTCYSFKDVNNWWIVKRPGKKISGVAGHPDVIQDRDTIELVHGISGRLLNSHDVAAPMSPECQEVTCYMDYNISMAPETLWRVKIKRQESDDNIWHAIHTQVQIIHVTNDLPETSPQALAVTGLRLPEWGFGQFEVVASDQHSAFTVSLWNVEEHRYTKVDGNAENDTEGSVNKPVQLSFWSKFLELQWSMLGLSKDTVEEHVYGSGPLQWIKNDNGVAFWAEKGTNRQIYQVGNSVIWRTGALVVPLTVVILLVFALWNMRYPKSLPVSPAQWNRILATSELLVMGFLFNWLLFFFTDRTLFFHHYFPGLAFKFLLIGSFFGEVYERFGNSFVGRHVLHGLCVVWLLAVIHTFVLYSPLTYGWAVLSREELRDLERKESWAFIIRN